MVIIAQLCMSLNSYMSHNIDNLFNKVYNLNNYKELYTIMGRAENGIHNPNAKNQDPGKDASQAYKWTKRALVGTLASIAFINIVSPVKDKLTDFKFGGGDFINNQYVPDIYYTGSTYNNDGGLFESDKDSYVRKAYECAGTKLVLKSFKAEYEPETPYTDPDAIADIKTTDTEHIPGPSPECANGTLEDADAKYKFWLDKEQLVFGPDVIARIF